MNRIGISEPPATTLERLGASRITSWNDIHGALDAIAQTRKPPLREDLAERCDALAFVTFDYGIDGVSMEIAKYAASLERLYGRGRELPTIHCIGGEFAPTADYVLADRWTRHEVRGANGWKKWLGGKWFDALFHEDMPEGSDRSNELAAEIWKQAVDHAARLSRYLVEQDIDVVIPVNVNSNPGNPAFALAVVLATELTGVAVVNSNHDFFWESGKPAAERNAGEPAGARDHFFRNHENESFFRLIKRIFPWNGKRWTQLTINAQQRQTLIDEYGFDESAVLELGTFIEDSYFTPFRASLRRQLRNKLGHILASGERTIGARSVDDFRGQVHRWMGDQVPLVCGAEADLALELTERNTLWLLQPTRVVTRKRIERNWELIGSLFRYAPFRRVFEDNADLTLALHVTGPVPVEHEADLVRILDAYKAVVGTLPPSIARRVFQVFTVGKLGHSEFQHREPTNLTVSDIYGLSDLVLLPSQTEGRGLPILEAAAAGVPLVCTQYAPRDVFANVIGESLKPDLRIRYAHFPEGRFSTALLQEVTDLLFLADFAGARKLHNRRAVAARFSMRELTYTFQGAVKRLEE